MKKSRIVIADERLLFSDALRIFLEHGGEFEVTIKQGRIAETIKSALYAKPEVLVIRRQKPELEVVQMLKEVKRGRRDVRVLFIVSEATGDLLSLAGESAGIGIMSESGGVEEFMDALHSVSRGERYVSKDIINMAAQTDDASKRRDPLFDITPREREVLYWLARGYTNKEISQRMILSEKTIKNHVSHLLKKLYLTDRTKAAALAWEEGLPQIPEDFFSLPSAGAMIK